MEKRYLMRMAVLAVAAAGVAVVVSGSAKNTETVSAQTVAASQNEESTAETAVTVSSFEYPDDSWYVQNVEDTGDGQRKTFRYNTAKNIKIQYTAFLMSRTGEVDTVARMKERFPNENIASLSKTDAIAYGREVCKKMGLEVTDELYACIALDSEHMNAMIDANPSLGKDKYGENLSYTTSADDAYYIMYWVKSERSGWAPSSYVTVIVGADGLLGAFYD